MSGEGDSGAERASPFTWAVDGMSGQKGLRRTYDFPQWRPSCAVNVIPARREGALEKELHGRLMSTRTSTI